MIVYSKNSLIVRDSEISDIAKIKMRPLEIAEVWASHHLLPEKALLESYLSSTRSLTFAYKNEVVGMFGVVPESLLADRAMVWLLTSTSIEKIKYSFLRLSRKFIRSMIGRYGTLYNYVDARNIQCLNWLTWCGANMWPAKSYGLDKMPFCYFELGGR